MKFSKKVLKNGLAGYHGADERQPDGDGAWSWWKPGQNMKQKSKWHFSFFGAYVF